MRTELQKEETKEQEKQEEAEDPVVVLVASHEERLRAIEALLFRLNNGN